MDPSAYKQYAAVTSAVPRPPIPNSQDQGREPESQSSSTDWTVSKPDIARGNLGRDAPASDPRMFLGWNVSHTAPPAAPLAPPPAASMKKIPTPWVVSYPDAISWGPYPQDDDEATPRPQEPSIYPYPNLSLPHPSLTLDFRMSITLSERIAVGSTPSGYQNWISFSGGSWSGLWGTGIVLAGGQDSEITTSNGSTRLDAKYLLQTHETPPAFITVRANGWTTGPPDVLANLANPNTSDSVDPQSYKFRVFVDMETGDERYRDKVNCGMWVGSGIRKRAEIIYDAYCIS